MDEWIGRGMCYSIRIDWPNYKDSWCLLAIKATACEL